MFNPIIISGFVGFLIGGFAMAVGMLKIFRKGLNTAWNEGYQYGTEAMLIKTSTLIKDATERKEAELFGKGESLDDP